MAKPWNGAITVEEAAVRCGLKPSAVTDLAALGGYPKAYGPFASVEGSAWRIVIDEPDLTAWIAAGQPRHTNFRPVLSQPKGA